MLRGYLIIICVCLFILISIYLILFVVTFSNLFASDLRICLFPIRFYVFIYVFLLYCLRLVISKPVDSYDSDC